MTSSARKVGSITLESKTSIAWAWVESAGDWFFVEETGRVRATIMWAGGKFAEVRINDQKVALFYDNEENAKRFVEERLLRNDTYRIP
jgi:hypothetical protein